MRLHCIASELQGSFNAEGGILMHRNDASASASKRFALASGAKDYASGSMDHAVTFGVRASSGPLSQNRLQFDAPFPFFRIHLEPTSQPQPTRSVLQRAALGVGQEVRVARGAAAAQAFGDDSH